MKRLLSFCAFWVLLSACDKRLPGGIVDVGLKVFVYDSNGNNLLNSNTGTGFNFEDISFEFSDLEGRILHAWQFEMNNPRLFEDTIRGNSFRLSSFVTRTKITPNPWVKIYWPDNTVDTVTYEIYDDKNRVTSITKVLVNGELAWPVLDAQKQESRFISFVKDV